MKMWRAVQNWKQLNKFSVEIFNLEVETLLPLNLLDITMLCCEISIFRGKEDTPLIAVYNLQAPSTDPCFLLLTRDLFIFVSIVDQYAVVVADHKRSIHYNTTFHLCVVS